MCAAHGSTSGVLDAALGRCSGLRDEPTSDGRHAVRLSQAWFTYFRRSSDRARHRTVRDAMVVRHTGAGQRAAFVRPQSSANVQACGYAKVSECRAR